MLKRIEVNLEAIEALYFFWVAARNKENVAEKFFHDIGQMSAVQSMYDDDFSEESVRRTLSAIKNREPFSGNKKERKFWNLNMWMMEDFDYTDSLIRPVKKLNLDGLVSELESAPNAQGYEEIEVIFSPMPLEDSLVKGNKLLVNFFRVKPGANDDEPAFGDTTLKAYIQEQLTAMLSK